MRRHEHYGHTRSYPGAKTAMGHPFPHLATNRLTSRFKKAKLLPFKHPRFKLMSNIPSNPNQAPEVPKEVQQPDETINSIMVDQAMASGSQPRFTIIDDGHGSVNLFVNWSSSQPTQGERRSAGVKSSIPLLYLDLPPCPN